MKQKPVLRRCVGCMEMRDKREVIRIALKQDGGVLVDFTGKSPGRGAYICKDADCVLKATRGRGLEKSFKRAVPKEVYESLKKEIVWES